MHARTLKSLPKRLAKAPFTCRSLYRFILLVAFSERLPVFSGSTGTSCKMITSGYTVIFTGCKIIHQRECHNSKRFSDTLDDRPEGLPLLPESTAAYSKPYSSHPEHEAICVCSSAPLMSSNKGHSCCRTRDTLAVPFFLSTPLPISTTLTMHTRKVAHVPPHKHTHIRAQGLQACEVTVCCSSMSARRFLMSCRCFLEHKIHRQTHAHMQSHTERKKQRKSEKGGFWRRDRR